MKYTLLLLAVFTLALASCEVGDMEVKKLNRGDGTWSIESIHYENYDSLGQHVVSDSTQSNVGEFVFFKTHTLDALFNYYLVVANMNHPDGSVIAHPGYIFYDGNRVSMKEDGDVNHNFPDQFEGVWTVTENKRRHQEWTIYSTNSSGNLVQKITLVLKRK